MTSNNSLQPRPPPHITVNSGSGGNLLDSMHSDSPQSSNADTPGTPGFPRQLTPSQRPLTGQSSRAPLPMYGSPAIAMSSEMLLPPSRAQAPRPYQDQPTDSPSRPGSAFSSRRTSFDSDAGSRDYRGPFASPFDDSRAPSRAGSDDDNINTQTVSEKYNIMPSAGLLLFPEDVEKDDYLHNPDPNDKDREKCDIFTKRGFVNVGGLVLITVGILVLFIGYPVLYETFFFLILVYANILQRTFARKVVPTNTCAQDSNCLSDKFPLLKNQRVGLIDPDTPESAYSKTSHDGTSLKLVVCFGRIFDCGKC